MPQWFTDTHISWFIDSDISGAAVNTESGGVCDPSSQIFSRSGSLSGEPCDVSNPFAHRWRKSRLVVRAARESTPFDVHSRVRWWDRRHKETPCGHTARCNDKHRFRHRARFRGVGRRGVRGVSAPAVCGRKAIVFLRPQMIKCINKLATCQYHGPARERGGCHCASLAPERYRASEKVGVCAPSRNSGRAHSNAVKPVEPGRTSCAPGPWSNQPIPCGSWVTGSDRSTSCHFPTWICHGPLRGGP